jgi:hypothetical protein
MLLELEKQGGASVLQRILEHVADNGDLAHLVLLMWAFGASFLLLWTMRELVASNRRFDDFVNELAHLNSIFRGGQG